MPLLRKDIISFSFVNALKRYFAYVCLLLILMVSWLGTVSNSFAESNNKYAAFVMDANTGFILHQDNANKILHPASLTKMMTLLMLFDALERDEIRLSSRLRISNHAASMIPSKLGLKPGSTIKVKDAINALTIKSANDIAVAVAEKLGGNEANFARMMTARAKELGLTNTKFRNASGLHDSKQVSTARDMAKLGRILVTDYSQYYHYFSKKKFTYQGKTYSSHNKLMDSYDGMDGLKTGYISQSGFNLVASVKRGNTRLVGTVFGGRTGKSRNNQMKKLLNESFGKLDQMQIAGYEVPIPRQKPVTAIAAYIAPDMDGYYADTSASRWDMLNTSSENSVFNRMIGQGDYDIDVRNRIETGLISISAHLGEDIPSYVLAPGSQQYALNNSAESSYPNKEFGDWSIQIGAFTTRERANMAVTQSLATLPQYLKHSKSTIAPLQTEQGWIFRGRLQGYTKKSARDACKILTDCIEIPPSTYQ